MAPPSPSGPGWRPFSCCTAPAAASQEWLRGCTPAQTHKNRSCITIIMSYSGSMARSGYRKMPCRQTHYKYNRGGRKGGGLRGSKGRGKKETKQEKSSKDTMKELRDHQRREYNFKEPPGGLSSPISRSVMATAARRAPSLPLSSINFCSPSVWTLLLRGECRPSWARSSARGHELQMSMRLQHQSFYRNIWEAQERLLQAASSPNKPNL